MKSGSRLKILKVVWPRSQVVKAGVCKTPIRRFDSARGLQNFGVGTKLLFTGAIPAVASMKPPKPKTKYILDKAQDQRIFKKLGVLVRKSLSTNQRELVKLLYSQLEDDWRTPLEEFVDRLIKEW